MTERSTIRAMLSDALADMPRAPVTSMQREAGLRAALERVEEATQHYEERLALVYLAALAMRCAEET